MHELSLVQGMMAQVMDLVRRHQAKKVYKIVVAIGPLSGVVVDSFRFAYEVFSKDFDETREAVLEIQEPGPSYRCSVCGHQAPDDQNDRSCPMCATGKMMPEGGDDLLLLSIEME